MSNRKFGRHPIGLSVVVPVYRGANSVGRLVEALEALRPEGGLEIVLVNDGSPDDSAQVCRALQLTARVPITYIEHTRNFGEHNAVMSGLHHARGAYVITMDDDLQNPPEEVIRLYDHTRLGGWDVVYARYEQKMHAPWRNLGSRFANWAADHLLDKPRGLYLSSFRCMAAVVVHEVKKYHGPYPYVDGLIMQITQRVDSLAVKHLARVEGGSNYTVARLMRLWLNLATNFSVLPLRFAVFVGMAMGVLGLFSAGVVVAEGMAGGTPSGWASLMAVVLLIASAQFLILGVLGEYVGRAFLTSNGKPQGVIREVIVAGDVGAAAPAGLAAPRGPRAVTDVPSDVQHPLPVPRVAADARDDASSPHVAYPDPAGSGGRSALPRDDAPAIDTVRS